MVPVPTRWRRWRTAYPPLGILVCALLSWGSPVAGQLRLNGQVMLGDSTLSQGTVVLHSVSPGDSGEIDSVSVDQEGRFGFTLPGSLEEEERTEVYFASMRHQGVLYFGEAVAQAQQLDSLYVITVYDSEVAPDEGLALPLAVRNIIMESDDDGWMAIDLMQIQNDGDRTIVASDSGVVWSHELPPGALDVELGQGDLPPGDVEFVNGRVVVRAPLPPGERLLLIRYRLAELPTEIPMELPTGVMELLVKEPTLPMLVPPLEAVAAVSIDDASYRRYTGQDLPAGLTLLVEETEPPAVFPVGWMAVLFTLILTSAGLYVYYRPTTAFGSTRTPATRPAPPPPIQVPPRLDHFSERGAIIVEIARLDERIATVTADADGDRDVLLAHRAELMDRLRAHH